MPVREGPPEPAPYPADKARSAKIELRRSRQRHVLVVLLVVLKLFA